MSIRKGHEPRGIQRMRQEADRLVDANQVHHKDFALAHRAQWENRTDQMMETQAIRRVARDLEVSMDEQLRDRRQRLGKLLADEDEIYKQELSSLSETPADRARRLIVHARQRKQEREAKREQFAQEQLRAQWREGCDDLRTIASEQFKQECSQNVKKQQEDNLRIKAEQQKANERYDALWEAQRQQRNALADEEERKKKAFSDGIKVVLTQQMKEAQQRREEEARRLEEEKQAFKERMQKDEEIAKQRLKEEAEQRRLEKQRVAVANQDALAKREEERARARAEEQRVLEAALKAHRAETQQKLIDKRQMRVERLQYMDYLKQRKQEEQKMEQEMERLVQEALDRDNAKEDMRKMREELARQELMRDVHATRLAQMNEKKEAEARAEKEKEVEKYLMDRDATAWRLRKDREQAEEREKAAQRKHDLQKQMEVIEMRNATLHAKAEQEHLNAKRTEEAYKRFVAGEREAPKQRITSFGKKKMEFT